MFRLVLCICFAVGLLIGLPQPGLSETFVPAGNCAVIAASRRTIQEAKTFIEENSLTSRATVYRSKNGWLAISIGNVQTHRADDYLMGLKADGSIPPDSYCSDGRKYVAVVISPKGSNGTRQTKVDASPSADFDARPLSAAEKRFLQAALALEGYYKGMLDGEWGRGSQTAFERFTQDNYSSEPINIHAAALLFTVIEEIVDGGWQVEYNAALDMSVVMPVDRMKLVMSENTRQEWIDHQTGLEFIFDRFTEAATNQAHLAVSAAHIGSTRPYSLRKPGLAISSALSASKSEYLRSQFVDGAWSTVYISAPLEAKRLVDLSAASLTKGRGLLLEIPDGGYLETQVDALLAVLQEPEISDETIAKTPPREEPDEAIGGSGSAFFVNSDSYAMTNAHVVEECRELRMAGRAADLVVSSDSFDLAVLRYSQPNDTLALKFSSGPAKLNSDVTIAGFPLHGWLGGLNVSRGAVSSLKGLGGTETTMQITAPIQPGNSGGPAVNSAGAVVGIVVSKLDAIAVANEIGDVPENVGFAVRGEIAQLFLSSNRINFEKNAGGDALTSEQIADHLQRSTVLVECLR